MFYLKYRPHTIEEIDNEKGREALFKILKAKELPHAFMFIGQKGTGKTSTARIFAKAVNCLTNSFSGTGDSIEPCNVCSNCLSIDTSSSPDVTEMDAASNRGIEEVKSLIRESAFAPMTGRYRVFIIDEAHMITNEAFNALLKTLEEPPASVLFILATTNEEKIPKTIASRCFKIQFGKAGKEDVRRMLKRITDREKLTVPADVIDMIVSHSEKSFRDAAKMLDELVIQDALTAPLAKKYLGIRAKQSLLEVMQKGSVKDALVWIEEFTASGGSVKNLIEEILDELRVALLTLHGVEVDDAPSYSYSAQEVGRLLKLFQESYTLLRSAPIEAIPLEIAVVEFYNGRTLNH